MTLRYTTVPNSLPESKMRMYPTKVINIIGGRVATSRCSPQPSFCFSTSTTKRWRPFPTTPSHWSGNKTLRC